MRDKRVGNPNPNPERDAPRDSDYYEQKLQAELRSNQSIRESIYPLSTRTLIIRSRSRQKFSPLKIIMTDSKSPEKEALYKLVIAAYNYSFYDKSAAISSVDVFCSAVPRFIDWLNETEIDNRYDVLKNYEAYHFDLFDNHGGSSALLSIKTIFTHALDRSIELYEYLTSEELRYLHDLRKTRVSPNLNKSHKSLATYFGGIDWLRRSDVGIGSDLYSILASPKLTVQSLSLSASNIILELYKSKLELHNFFKLFDFKVSEFTLPKDLSHTKKREFVGLLLYKIISFYHKSINPNPRLYGALEIVLLSTANSFKSFERIKCSLISQEYCNDLFLNKNRDKKKVSISFCADNFSQVESGNLFSLEVLRELSKNDFSCPTTALDELMFSWLMASLTVQPYDIPKLTHNSFRMLKVGGAIREIECKYFKSRAKVYCTIRSLSTKTLEGKALVTYLSMKKEGSPLCVRKAQSSILMGLNSLNGSLYGLLTTNSIQASLIKQHLKLDNLPLVIPRALEKLLGNGKYIYNSISNPVSTSNRERTQIVNKFGTTCPSVIFGLKMIKNSAVHAYSDPYTLNYLVNRNSHTNRTEKENYLNSENEAWINSSGRITREVMLDLINNVFDLNFDKLPPNNREEVVEEFNSEFMVVTENISYRSEEMLARLKVVTGKKKGKMNEVGVFVHQGTDDNTGFSHLYVIDSPITAWKMNNYLHEFKKDYKKLLSKKPEYFYKTVLPTVEWIEHTLSQLSKDSQKIGLIMFEKSLRNGVVVSVFG